MAHGAMGDPGRRVRIVDIKVTPIAFRDPPLRNAAGVHEPYALRSIIEITASNGQTGLGEDLDLFLEPFPVPGLLRQSQAIQASQSHHPEVPGDLRKLRARQFRPVEVLHPLGNHPGHLDGSTGTVRRDARPRQGLRKRLGGRGIVLFRREAPGLGVSEGGVGEGVSLHPWPRH